MADPFVAEIRMVAFNFPPKGWAQCNGQILPIAQNTALFSLIGTYYGGNGKSNFALPDLQGRSPMFWGVGQGLSERFLGETSGTETVTLLQTEIPAHTHTPMASNVQGSLTTPQGNAWARAVSGRQSTPEYGPGENWVAMSPAALNPIGGSQPHSNLSPYLVLNFAIALQGIFPPRS